MSSARRQRRILVWYSFGTACVVALLVGVILVLRDHTLTADAVSSSIGLNLIASVVFALMFAGLANWFQERNIEETVTERIDELGDRITKGMELSNTLFLPSNQYEPLNPTDDDFGYPYNRDMTSDLQRSGMFAFYGSSARYVAARLEAATRPPQEIKIVMISPAHDEPINRRATDRTTSWPQATTIDQMQRELHDELLRNLVALFDYRKKCPVEVLYNDDTSVYRYVLLEQALYVSWYHGAESRQKEMPESFRFGKDSFLYLMFRMDLLRRFNMSTQKVRFEAQHDDSFLIDHLRSLTNQDVRQADIDRWRAEERRHSAAFRRFLGKIYTDLNQRSPGSATHRRTLLKRSRRDR